MKVAVLAGDGVGPEIIGQAVRVLKALEGLGIQIELEEALVGGAAIEQHGIPLPEESVEVVNSADAVLFGAVGAPQFDRLPHAQKPGAALRTLRKSYGLYCNLRPVKIFEALIDASALKPAVVSDLDILFVRELNSDIYYGQPRGVGSKDGKRYGINTMYYDEQEIARIAHAAFTAARGRRRAVCSIDKSNVLETMGLWREVATEVAQEYPDVSLSHMLVDAAAMTLVRDPRRFDVILAPNLFGDILSDQASMLTGSIGMLPSASINGSGFGLYEPIHGSAPDIASKGIANPIATILSAALMLRHSFDLEEAATCIETAVADALADGLRTADIAQPGGHVSSTHEVGTAIIERLSRYYKINNVRA